MNSNQPPGWSDDTNAEPAATELDQALVDQLSDAMGPRIEAVRARVAAAAGNPATRSPVKILAVSKLQPAEAVVAARTHHVALFGENYAQELRAKSQAVGEHDVTGDSGPGLVEWHFIGQLQRNRVRQISDITSVWQSVDRIRVGAEIAKRAPGARVFVQANLSMEPAKAGCDLGEVPSLVQQLRELGLNVEGLMGVGSAGDEIATGKAFAHLRSLVDSEDLAECSMGMSADLDIAIREGSTMVRVGTAIFGERPKT